MTGSAFCGIQGEGGIGRSEGVGDGERAGLAAQGSPIPNSSMEEAVTGGRGIGLQQRNSAEVARQRGGVLVSGTVRADRSTEDGAGVA